MLDSECGLARRFLDLKALIGDVEGHDESVMDIHSQRLHREQYAARRPRLRVVADAFRVLELVRGTSSRMLSFLIRGLVRSR